MANEFKFQPTVVAEAVNKKLFIKRLPEWMQGLEQIQTFCDDIIQQWFNPAEQEIVDGYIGDSSSPAASGKIFIKELTEQRQAYQLSPAYVSKNEDQSIRSMQFYEDLVGYLENYGCLAENQDRLFNGKFYSWTPPINPNKLINYSTYLWDTENEYAIAPDYVVMERGALNGNTWSLQNFWYTVGQTLADGTILTDELAQSSRFARAQAPVIEYNKNIELLNYGTKFRGVVNYLSDSVKPEDIVNKSQSDNIRVDGNILKAGDRVLFTSIGNPGENNRIYKVYIKSMDGGSRVYGLALDEDEETTDRPSGEPHVGDVVLVKSGNVYANIALYWNGSAWTRAQAKAGINTFPLFQLYDRNAQKLSDSQLYPSSNFAGSSLFGLKINFDYNFSSIYGANVELSSYNYYVFENFIQSVRYTFNKLGVVTEIPGLYYYNVITENDTGFQNNLKTDWVRSTDESKQFVFQVPEVTKTAMYRVFDTVKDMELFNAPVENMYAYVRSVDANYRYYKADNSTFMDWHRTSDQPAAYDVYNHTYEVSQKIDPSNTSDILEIMVDGIKINDYTVKLNLSGMVDSVVIDNSVDITEDSVVTIRTYSKDKVPDLNIGAYEIPINLKNNPYNESVKYIHQGDYTPHFQEIIRKNITSGSVDDFNDYEERLSEGLVDNSVGTQIIQNEASMLPLMLNTANENIDLFEAFMFLQSEYFRFLNKFNTQMINLYDADKNAFLANSASNLVDAIFGIINVGKNDTFPFYLDNVGSTISTSRTFIPPTPQFLGILKAFAPQKATYVYAGKDLGCYNISHTGIISKAYKVINGIDKMDDIIFELENRIFNSIDNAFKVVDYQPPMDSSDLFPTPYFNSTDYSSTEHNTLLLRGYINFIATNGISNSTTNYDQSNWMTWNYTGTTYVVNGSPSTIPARGSWRGIYTDMFGTYRPATHPWEMLGFAQRPDWWNQEYEPTTVRIGEGNTDFITVYTAEVVDENGDLVPSGLWDVGSLKGDVSTGTILFGSRAGQYDKYKRFGKQPFTLTLSGTTSSGENIYTYELISPDVLGLVSGSLNHRAEPWVYGDMGDMEFTYMNTGMFPFDKALLLYRAKPAQFANYFYDTRGSTLKQVTSDGLQFLYGESNTRLNFNSKTIVNGENNTRVLGYQMAITDNLIYQNKNVTTKYGDVLRSSYINIGHKLGGFTKQDQLSFYSESFGLISNESQHIGLIKSSAIRNEVLSAVKITWNGSAYKIDGYDLVGAKFTVQVPNKNGKKITTTQGVRSVVTYTEYTQNTQDVVYGTVFNSFQDVYTFLCSYGQYLESKGWIFEEQNDDGVILDWVQIAKDFLDWSQTILTAGEFISVSPSTASVKFGSEFGTVLSVTQYNGGVWSLLDDNNEGIRPYEIQTTRLGSVFTVRLADDVDKRIALVRLSLASYEHAVIFDDTTIFGDSIYIPVYGSVQELIRMYGYITGSWNGRLEAPGFIVLESGTLPDFETLVTDFQQYYDIDEPVSDVTLRDLGRHLIGYQTRDYLAQMITSEPSRVNFYKGFIRDKGTNQVLERVLRVSKSYNTDEYKALQEWAFKVGVYGNIYGKKSLQFQLVNNEFKQQPQLVSFDVNATDSGDSNSIVYFGKQGDDSRWITRPNGHFSFPQRSGRSENINLPDIGPVTLDEVDYTTRDYTTAYTDRLTYMANSGEVPTSTWMFHDMDDTWNIFDLSNTGVTLTAIEAIDSGDGLPTTHCKLILSAAHNMSDGDYFYFVDPTNYMPDLLKSEKQYYSTGSAANEIIVPVNISIDMTFSAPQPSLYRYVSRFSTPDVKTAYIDKKYSFNAPETTLFDKATTYNSQTNVTELYINIYDPINGVLPGPAMTNVSFVGSHDPALYNSNGEAEMAWASDKVGTVWWDTREAYFLDYTRPIYDVNGNVDAQATLEYKRVNWGKLLPSGDINIYEWVSSPVEPYAWDNYCTEQARLNKTENSYVPSGEALEENYCEFMVYDTSTQTYVRKFYFWVKNSIYVPQVKNRDKSCQEIARIIKDPMVLNTPWFSPISETSFIMSNMQYEVNDDKSILTVTYKEDHDDVIKHEQYQLCKEGDNYNFNPVIWDSLWNSLIGQEPLVDGKYQELHYPETELGLGSSKVWFEDIIEARRTFVDSANDVYRHINMTTNTVVMNDVFNVKTTEVNPNQVGFKVLTYNNELVIATNEQKFLENDAVLVNTNGTLPSPLISTSVYFVHYDENGYIHLMNNPSSSGSVITITLENKGEGQHNMIKQTDYIESLGTSLDMTQYWSLADWYDIGYNSDTEYTDEISIDIANTKNYQIGDIIRVTDSDGVWTLYRRDASRNVLIWTAIGRQNSTVALNNQLYNDYTQYDSNGALTNVEINVRKALALFKNSFDGYQSNIVFDMVKYVHVEQQVVDWVFKTSYIYIVGLDQSLKQNYSSSEDLIGQIISYFEEVKPYRTKIRSQIEQKTSDTDEINGLLNDLDPTGYILQNGKWVKTQSDIWDYEYAQFNPTTNKWEVKGSLPSDFTTPNRRFQEIDVIMHYDNVQCMPDANMPAAQVLEDINNQFQSNDNDFLSTGSEYKLQRYSYTIPEANISQIENSISIGLSGIYSTFDVNVPTKDAINAMYEQFSDDIDATTTFTNDVINITNSVIDSQPSVDTMQKYRMYNTLSNRLKLYTSYNEETIEEQVNCPFKGVVVDDNPNTRLPFGYSASNGSNFGYVMHTRELFNIFYKRVKAENPSFTESEVYYYLAYEYGLYTWTALGDEGDVLGHYNDTLYVLTAMRNSYYADDADHYAFAEAIINNRDIDAYCMVMIPRKLVYVRNDAGTFLSVPFDQSLTTFMEDTFITSGDNVYVAEPNLDDLPMDPTSPLYSDYQSIVEAYNTKEYYDDMNSYDNLALESQTKRIVLEATDLVNTIQDSSFIDISELNPNKQDMSQLRFTVDGYSYDAENMPQLKDQGNFQVEGYITLNPYNKSEALVSIPRYEEAIALMDRTSMDHQYIKYTNHVYDVLTVNGQVKLDKNHGLVVGDTVAVFTPEGSNYDAAAVDGTFVTILSDANIRTGNRPRMFTVSAVNDRVVTIAGLVFNTVYNSDSDMWLAQAEHTSITIVRVTSFNDTSFAPGNYVRYAANRSYAVDALDYDVFYDVMLDAGEYTDNLPKDDYDVWYVSNELFVENGVEVDHGYYQPIYGQGALSELIRTKMNDSLQIFVYEYTTGSISPVYNSSTGKWTYSQALVDNVFIQSNSTCTVITNDSVQNVTYVSKPSVVGSITILDSVVTGVSSGEGDIVSLKGEQMFMRKNGNVIRSYNGTVDNYYEQGVSFTANGLNLGQEEKMDIYSNNYPPIPLSTYSSSITVTGAMIPTLLKV
jgi:hypothetical protein